MDQHGVRPTSIDSIVQAHVANAFIEQKKLIFREIGEVFLSFARGAAAPNNVQVVEIDEVAVAKARRGHRRLPPVAKEREIAERKRITNPWYYRFAHKFAEISEKIWKKKCEYCGTVTSSGYTVESKKHNRHNGATVHNRYVLVIKQYEAEGVEAVRGTWRILCRGCSAATAPTKVAHFGIARMSTVKSRELFLKIFGRKCPECGDTPAVKEVLCDGPGKDTVERLNNFVELYFDKGEDAAKKRFSSVCRSCATKAGVGPQGKNLSNVHAA